MLPTSLTYRLNGVRTIDLTYVTPGDVVEGPARRRRAP